MVVDVLNSFLSKLDSQCSCVLQQRIEIRKLRQGEHLILGFSIGGGIDQDPGQNPFSEDKSDKVRVKHMEILSLSVLSELCSGKTLTSTVN